MSNILEKLRIKKPILTKPISREIVLTEQEIIQKFKEAYSKKAETREKEERELFGVATSKEILEIIFKDMAQNQMVCGMDLATSG